MLRFHHTARSIQAWIKRHADLAYLKDSDLGIFFDVHSLNLDRHIHSILLLRNHIAGIRRCQIHIRIASSALHVSKTKYPIRTVMMYLFLLRRPVEVNIVMPTGSASRARRGEGGICRTHRLAFEVTLACKYPSSRLRERSSTYHDKDGWIDPGDEI